MHVNRNASASFTVANSTLSTNSITCGPISCAGSTTKPTTPTVVGVHIGLDYSAVGGIEICASSTQYIDYSQVLIPIINGRMQYIRCNSSLILTVGAHATPTPNMTLLPSGLSVSGVAVSSDKRLKFNEKP